MQEDQQSVDELKQEQVELEQQKSTGDGLEEVGETSEQIPTSEIDPTAKEPETEDQVQTKKTLLQKLNG